MSNSVFDIRDQWFVSCFAGRLRLTYHSGAYCMFFRIAETNTFKWVEGDRPNEKMARFLKEQFPSVRLTPDRTRFVVSDADLVTMKMLVE